jgi:hypothetical protein
MLERIPMQTLIMLLSIVVIAAFWHLSELYGDPAPIFAGLSLQIIGLFITATGIESVLKKIHQWLNSIELVQQKKKSALAGVGSASFKAFSEDFEGMPTAVKHPAKQKSGKKRIKELELAIKTQKKRERQLSEYFESGIMQAVGHAQDQVNEELQQLQKQQSELAKINAQRRYVLLGLSWIVAGMLISAQASLIS